MVKKIQVPGITDERQKRKQLAEGSLEEFKLCPGCKFSKALNLFGFRNKERTSYKSYCNACACKLTKNTYDYKKKRTYALKYYYNLTDAEYEILREAQNYSCAICGLHESEMKSGAGRKPTLHIDHCHKTNKVRGLLCYSCNTALGKIENKNLLDKFVAYLKS